MISFIVDFFETYCKVNSEMVLFLEALLTPVVAIFAGIIAFKQLKIQKEVYSIQRKQLEIEEMANKMNLYEKRYKIYEATKEFLFVLIVNLEFPNVKVYQNFIKETDSHVFIFNDEILLYMIDLKKKSKNLNILTKKINDESKKEVPNFGKLLENRNEITDWLFLQEGEIEEKFGKYLKLV